MNSRKLIFIILLSIASFEIEAQTDSFEVAIANCLDSTFSSFGFDLFAELEAFEHKLIKEEQLKGTQVNYQELFSRLKDDLDIVFYRDYEAQSPLDSLFRPEFGQCFNSFRNSTLFENSDSFYKRLSLALEQARLRGYDNSYEFFLDNLIKTLKPEDYKNSLFRYYAIYTIYVGALNSNYREKDD